MTLPIHHIALKVENLEQSERFYTDILGLKVTSRHNDDKGYPRSVWLDCQGTILMLEKAESKSAPAQKGWYLVALKIAAQEREKWKAKLVEHGIKITGESKYSIYFTDPENNRLALSHYPETQPKAD